MLSLDKYLESLYISDVYNRIINLLSNRDSNHHTKCLTFGVNSVLYSPVGFPFYYTEADCAQNAEHRKDSEVPVKLHHTRVKEAGGGRQRLRELVQRESRARVVLVDGAEDGVDLRVEAGVAEAQHSAAEEGDKLAAKNKTCRRRRELCSKE